MEGVIKKGFIPVCILLIILEFGKSVFNLGMISNVMSILGLLLIFIALFSIKPNLIALPIILTVIALLLSVKSIIGYDFTSLWAGLREMQPVIVLDLVIPLVGIVLRQEHYMESLLLLFSRLFKSVVRIHASLLSMTQIVAFFLLPATAPIMYQFVKDSFGQGKQWHYIKETAIYRGVALAGIWAFSLPSFAYAVETLHIPLFKAMTNGIILAILGVFLSTILIYFYIKRKNANLGQNITFSYNTKDSSEHVQKSFEFFCLLSMLLFGIFIANYLLPLSLLILIPLIIIFWVYIVALFKSKNKIGSEIKQYVKNDMYNKRKEVFLFMAAGLLVSSLDGSGIGKISVNWILDITNNNLWFNFLILLPLIVSFLGVIGIPPSAAMILVAGIVGEIHLPYSDESVLLALTLGSVTSVLISPIAVPSILLSSVNGLPPWKISIQKNAVFAVTFFMLAEVYIYILRLMGC